MPIQLASAGACFSMQLLRLCQTLQVQREADWIDGGFNVHAAFRDSCCVSIATRARAY